MLEQRLQKNIKIFLELHFLSLFRRAEVYLKPGQSEDQVNGKSKQFPEFGLSNIGDALLSPPVSPVSKKSSYNKQSAW